MSRTYKHLALNKVKKFRILILIGIATTFSIGIIALFYPLKEKVDSIISLAVGGIVTGFLSYYQSKDEIKRTDLLKQINNITKIQERIHLSLIRGPLIGISVEIGRLRKKLKDSLELATVNNIEKLQCFYNENEICFKSTCDKIREEAYHIRPFIGEIYQEIVTTTRYFDDSVSVTDLKHSAKPETLREWKYDCKKAIHEADILRDHIDNLLFLQLDPKDFDTVKISTALKSDCIIVVGSMKERDESDELGIWKRAEDDWIIADALCQNINEKYNSKRCKMMIDRDINQKKLHENNIILIGGTRINTLTRDLSSRFPIQYVQIGGSDNFFPASVGRYILARSMQLFRP